MSKGILVISCSLFFLIAALITANPHFSGHGFVYHRLAAASVKAIPQETTKPKNSNSASLSAGSTVVYHADISGGIIGSVKINIADNPYDNIFHIYLPELPNAAKTFFLQYDLFGVTNHSGIARSINDEQSSGGQLVTLNNKWTTQKEMISVTAFRKGDNAVRFSLPAHAGYSYRVRNLSVVAEKKQAPRDIIFTNQPGENYDGRVAYIKGIIESSSLCKEGSIQLFCNNKPINVYDGGFEAVLTNPAKKNQPFTASLRAVLASGSIIRKKIIFTRQQPVDYITNHQQKGLTQNASFIPGRMLELDLSRHHLGAAVQIPGDALLHKAVISITALRDVDLPALNPDMVNVTKGSAGFRFLPHGSRFEKPAHLSIPYDSALIPEGYTAADIRTYFFNESLRRWEVLPFDTAITEKGIVQSFTGHFTDMINGIIKVPESPQTQGYTPTSIKDLKAADPSAGITLINPPTANSMGAAALDFPLKLPAGRHGMQPSLSLQYSNEAGYSWVGYGWSLSIPSVNIETRWGAPRYDKSLETESYTVNGLQLAPVFYRGALVNRVPDKKFTTRTEGAFNRIIRHGDNPANYWWEVTGKDGIHQYYGGTPAEGVRDNAVLKDNNGNIACWQLAETRDPNDNFVRYEYAEVTDAGIAGGTVAGKQIYISKIYYTGYGKTDGAYQVEFIRDRQLGEAKRKDVEISGKLGFKMVSADCLRRIEITINGTAIRSYECMYKEGVFHKTLLNTISELDAEGKIFYTYPFTYYDDVSVAGALQPVKPAEDWSPDLDNIKGDIINPLPGFTAEGSALSTSKSSNTNGGLALTLGSGYGGFWSKILSVGGSFGYGQDDAEGLVSLVDINGDGMPDKVFKKNGQLYYRANTGKVNSAFGTARKIQGASDFSKSNSSNISWGSQIIPFVAFFGSNSTTTNSSATDYFSDFNGDGLIDIVSGGQVLFNHLDAAGDPVFASNSTLTPSPVQTGIVDKNFLKPDLALQAQQEIQFPLQDAVRLWEAPFDGVIHIIAPVQLVNVLNQPGLTSKKKDGVRVSIQLGNTVLWNTAIAAADYSIKTPVNLAQVTIKKGERLYFRVQSVYNGQDDCVNWDPEILYTSTVPSAMDANGKKSGRYKASEDYVLDTKSKTRLAKDGVITIDGNFRKMATSDTVIAGVIRERTDGTTENILWNVYPPDSIVNDNFLITGLQVKSGENLRFILESSSHIDRTAMNWLPHYSYTAFADNTPALNYNGDPSLQETLVAENTNFNSWVRQAAPLLPSNKDTVLVKPQIKYTSAGTDSIFFAVKKNNKIISRRTLFVANGKVTNTVPDILLTREINEPVYFEYTSHNHQLAATITEANAIIQKDTSYTDQNNNLVQLTLSDTVAANLYADPAQDFFGPLFRGWGQFAFKGNVNDTPLDENKLNLSEYNNFPTDPAKYTDPASFNQLPDPSKADFVALYAHPGGNNWTGYDTAVYVGAATMASSRLFMHDVAADSLMQGESVSAVSKISKTETKSNSLGFSAGVSASKGITDAVTTTTLDMMDLNGDRYPDVIAANRIQYTLPNGRLETAGHTNSVGIPSSKGHAEGWTLGGSFPVASTGKGTGQSAATEQKQACASIGLNGNIGKNDDESISTWTDINGDGLPDRIYKDGTVSLNLGYTFAAAENWGPIDADKNSSSSQGAGLGVTIDAASFQGGFGLSRGNGTGAATLQDMNGDGLPDKVYLGATSLQVQINTGNGFSAPVNWNNANSISSNVNTGESLNAAFTIIIPIPIPFFPLKICINPSFSTGHGVSRRQDQIMDIDGDGFPDMLHSDNDGNLSALRSTIGRTNMLKSIQRPLGGYLALDYERTGNTYQLPQSKWVLKSTVLTDGVPGDGADTARTVFTYSNAVYNRHERDFYGFATVTAEQLTTASGNKVYRRRVQQFLNNSLYTKNLVAAEWLEDAQGRKYTQTNNTYELRRVADSSNYPALVLTTKLMYEGKSSADVQTATQFDYDAIGNVIKINDAGDGTQQDMMMATVSYHNLDAPYIKSVPSGITVTTLEGVKRKRSTVIDPKGQVIRIQQFLADETAATTDIEYDMYGNLQKLTKPGNYKKERMWHAYEYDNTVHSYVTKVNDAFGYSSASAYDYRFGSVISSLSMNNEPMRYTYDSRGRLATITGPYEIAAGKPYTIAQEYHPDTTVPYAVTRHYDPEYDATIKTITFMDGLGRPVQVKKQAALFKGVHQEDDLRMIVSGRVLYDAFGRAAETYFPVTESMAAANNALNLTTGSFASSSEYDVQDRPVKTTLADGAVTVMEHSTVAGMLSNTVTDARGNKKEMLSDVQGRNRLSKVYGGPDGTITTTFFYNALSELLRIVDTKGNASTNTYDNLGRKTSTFYPDAGLSTFSYDLAGNLLEKTTAQIKKQVPAGGAIKYGYQYERLTDIDYPVQYQNKVKYTYGSPGDGNRAGRLLLQEDASGGQEFFYGKLGEITKTIRTVLVTPAFSTTYVSEQEYDTWNRMKKMTYPDGETVLYHYNRGGSLKSMEGSKLGNNYSYVDQLGYDEYEQRVYLKYGNGTEMKYTYDPLRRRLATLDAITSTGRAMMKNTYAYDKVSNILGIVNKVQADTGMLGGYAAQEYDYDNLYRLVTAKGVYRGAKLHDGYTLQMSYDNLYNITGKSLSDSTPGKSYHHLYQYNPAAPHQLLQAGDDTYNYDANGNMLGTATAENFWDEDNRLMAVIKHGRLSQYTYDAAGDRVIKSSGGIQGVWVNGAPAGAVKHTDNYTLYVSPYLVCRKTGFTKHFYIESQRITSKMGIGSFTNINFPQTGLTAGNVDYSKRAAIIEQNRTAYYASLGVSPGPPTDKNFWAKPENNGIQPPVFVDSSVANTVPPGWPGNTTPPPVGPPIFVGAIPTAEDVHAGYGFAGTGHEYEKLQYFYHPDHLGSASYVTDVLGEVNQHQEYIAFGETFFEEHATSASTPYLFNGKERDAETGLYYYGARYYDPMLSLWMSVDPMKDKYPGLSAYNYGLNNPVRMTDPDGREADDAVDIEKLIKKNSCDISDGPAAASYSSNNSASEETPTNKNKESDIIGSTSTTKIKQTALTVGDKELLGELSFTSTISKTAGKEGKFATINTSFKNGEPVPDGYSIGISGSIVKSKLGISLSDKTISAGVSAFGYGVQTSVGPGSGLGQIGISFSHTDKEGNSAEVGMSYKVGLIPAVGVVAVIAGPAVAAPVLMTAGAH